MRLVQDSRDAQRIAWAVATRFKQGRVLKSPVDGRIYSRTHHMVNSVERDVRINRGEVCEVREMPGWERVRVQIDSGAMATVGPKEIARAFEMMEMVMSKRGVGFVAASESGIKHKRE